MSLTGYGDEYVQDINIQNILTLDTYGDNDSVVRMIEDENV